MRKLSPKAGAMRIVKQLRRNGYEGLFVGGCVRDMLRGRRPEDYDIATNATPQTVRRLFKRVLMVGAKFGVAIVLDFGRPIEVATFRSDVSYSDGRHPDRVVFSNAREDALRRDFTVNGMFYDPIAGRVIDYVGGQEDLRRRLIRAIGPPRQRFSEDYLRMLRAVRLAANLEFAIERHTRSAIRELAEHITEISAERICEELRRILTGANAAAGLQLADELALLVHLLPEPVYQNRHRAQQLLQLLGRIKSFALGLAALLYKTAPAHVQLCRRLRTSKAIQNRVGYLLQGVEILLQRYPWQLSELKKLRADAGFDDLLRLHRAVVQLERIGPGRHRQLLRRITAIAEPRELPRPLITGHDLMAMGFAPGPALGRMLDRLYTAQLNEQIRTKAQALKLLKQWLTCRNQ